MGFFLICINSSIGARILGACIARQHLLTRRSTLHKAELQMKETSQMFFL